MSDEDSADRLPPDDEAPPRSQAQALFGDHQPALWRTMTDLDRQRDRVSRRYRSHIDVNSWLDPALNFLRRHEERSTPYMLDHRRIEPFQPAEISDMNTTAAAFDFRSLEPVVEPDSNLFCPICHCLFVQPLQLPCEHVFCSECLKSTPNEQGLGSRATLPCPSCRRTCDRKWIVKAPKLIDRILDDVIMKCPSSSVGCQETTARASIENHVTRYCQFALVDCPSEECKEKVERHLSEKACLHKLKPCEDCRKELMEIDLQKHRRNSCEEAYNECTGCKEMFRALEVEDHAKTCLEVEIGCVGQEYGCKFTSKRKSISEHETACLLCQAGPYLSKQVARIDDHENTIKDLRLKNRALADSVTSMHSTIQVVLGDESNNQHGSTDSRTASTQPFDSQISHVLDLHTSLEDQVRRIEAAVAALDAKIELQNLNHNLRATEEKLHRDAVETHMRRQLQWLVSAKLQSQRAASSLLRAAGQDPPSLSNPAGVGPSTAQPTLDRRRSDEILEPRGPNIVPIRRSSDSGREKL